MNYEDENTDLQMCLSCIGSGSIYDARSETCNDCLYCNAVGYTTEAMNESFLSEIINYN